MNISKPVGDRLTLQLVELPGPDQGCRGELVIMDDQAGDILIKIFTGQSFDSVERQAGRYLRELGRLVDGVPTVTGVFVRNDAMVTHDEARRELGEEVSREPFMNDGEGWDVLKVMVELEHETNPRRMRIVHQTNLLHDQLGQNIDWGHYGHDTWREDPVTKAWRRDHETRENPASHPPQSFRDAPRPLMQLGPPRVLSRRKSRSRGKRTT